MPVPLIIAGIVAAVGAVAAAGVGAGASAATQSAAASEAAKRLMDAAAQYNIPLETLNTALRDYGIPESMLAKIQENQVNIDRQSKVFAELEGIADAKGMDSGFQAGLNNAINAAGRSYSANSGAVMRQLQGSGMANSPLKYALLQQSAADAAGNAGNMGMQALMHADDRRMRALDEMEGLAGRMRDQDFRTQVTKASAQDELNRFNKQMAFNAVNQQMQAIEQNNANKRFQMSGRANALANQAQQTWQAGNAMAGNISNVASNAGAGLGQMAIGVGGYLDSKSNPTGQTWSTGRSQYSDPNKKPWEI